VFGKTSKDGITAGCRIVRLTAQASITLRPQRHTAAGFAQLPGRTMHAHDPDIVILHGFPQGLHRAPKNPNNGTYSSASVCLFHRSGRRLRYVLGIGDTATDVSRSWHLTTNLIFSTFSVISNGECPFPIVLRAVLIEWPCSLGRFVLHETYVAAAVHKLCGVSARRTRSMLRSQRVPEYHGVPADQLEVVRAPHDLHVTCRESPELVNYKHTNSPIQYTNRFSTTNTNDQHQ